MEVYFIWRLGMAMVVIAAAAVSITFFNWVKKAIVYTRSLFL